MASNSAPGPSGDAIVGVMVIAATRPPRAARPARADAVGIGAEAPHGAAAACHHVVECVPAHRAPALDGRRRLARGQPRGERPGERPRLRSARAASPRCRPSSRRSARRRGRVSARAHECVGRRDATTVGTPLSSTAAPVSPASSRPTRRIARRARRPRRDPPAARIPPGAASAARNARRVDERSADTSPSNAFSASASSTTGPDHAREHRVTSSRARVAPPSPGPMTRVAPIARSRASSVVVRWPRGRERRRLALLDRRQRSRSRPRAHHPAPLRSAARAASTAAPAIPFAPPTIGDFPSRPLVRVGRDARHATRQPRSSSTSSGASARPRRACARRARCRATTIVAARFARNEVAALDRAEGDREIAQRSGPALRPVLASSPVGTSSATTDAPRSREASQRLRPRPRCRRAGTVRREAGAQQRVDDDRLAAGEQVIGAIRRRYARSERRVALGSRVGRAGRVHTPRRARALPLRASARATTQRVAAVVSRSRGHQHARRRVGPGNDATISAAAAAPARCISARDGTPAAIAAESHADAPSGVDHGDGKWTSAHVGRVTRAARGGYFCDAPTERPYLELAVVDPDVEPALGVAAHPCLVGDGGAVAAVVAQRQQRPRAALAAGRELRGTGSSVKEAVGAAQTSCAHHG